MPFLWFKRRQPVAAPARQRFFRNTPVQVIGDQMYQRDSFYVLPKGGDEDERLDAQHTVIRWFHQGQLHYAPVNLASYRGPGGDILQRQVLDVGCGSGLWSRDMAKRYTEAHIIGYDMTIPAFVARWLTYMELPESRRKQMEEKGMGQPPLPVNFQYVEGNIFVEDSHTHQRRAHLPFATGHFDFVFQRLWTGAIPTQFFAQEVAELRRVTRPGGWIELIESCGALNTGPALTQLTTWGKMVSARNGIDIDAVDQIGFYLQQLRPQHFKSGTFDIPIGRQADRNKEKRHIVDMMTLDYMAVIKKMGVAVVRLGIASQEDFNLLYERALIELQTPAHTFVHFYWAIAQFP